MLLKGACNAGSCPQCRRRLDGELNRLVTDGCGHVKCRFCLLQEMSGCLKCSPVNKQKEATAFTTSPIANIPSDPQQRKSVIMGPINSKSDPPMSEKSTKHILQQSLKTDILFPTEIVKKSTGGYFHLKRVMSERYHNEEEKRGAENKVNKLPPHIVHYCDIHGVLLRDEASIGRHKMCKKNCCDICNKTFTGLATLQKHRRSHRPRRYTCSVCFKHFRDNYARQVHKRIHSGIKAYKCDICNVEFKQLYGLKRHLAVHQGEKKFGCEKCKYRAMTKGELNKHLKTHNTPKSFVCNVCGLRFNFKKTMLRHSISHDPKATPIECTLCGVSFKRKDNLIRHTKNAHHGDKIPEINPDTPSDITTIFEFDQNKINPP